MQSPTSPPAPPSSNSPLISPSCSQAPTSYPTVPLITIPPPQQISSVSGPSPILGSKLGMARTVQPMHTHSHSHSHTTVVIPVHYHHYGYGGNKNQIENAENRQKIHIAFNSTPIKAKVQQQPLKTPSFSNIPIQSINFRQTSPSAIPTESKPQSSTTAPQKNENTREISQNRVKRAKSYEVQTLPSFIHNSAFHPRPHPYLNVIEPSPSLNQQPFLNKNIHQKMQTIQNCNIIPISPLYVVRCCDFCAQNRGYANDIERIEREGNWQRERKLKNRIQIWKEEKFTDKQFRQNGFDGLREKIGCEDQTLWKNMASTNEEQFNISNKHKHNNEPKKNNEKSPKKPKPQKSYLTETDQKPQKCRCCKYCQYPPKYQTKAAPFLKLSQYSPYFPNSSNSVFSACFPSPSPSASPYSYMTHITPSQNQPSLTSPIKSKYANPNRIQKQVMNRIKYSNSKYTKTSPNEDFNNKYADKRKSRSKKNIENKKQQKNFEDQNYQYQLRREKDLRRQWALRDEKYNDKYQWMQGNLNKNETENNGYGYSSNMDDINAVIQDLKQQNRLLKLATQYI